MLGLGNFLLIVRLVIKNYDKWFCKFLSGYQQKEIQNFTERELWQ